MKQLPIQDSLIANIIPAEFAELQVKTGDRHKCFMIMPFGDADLQAIYECCIRPLINACHLDCERGDDETGSGVIMDDINASIDAADIVIADLSGKNANVFYELGIADTKKKPVLLMAQSVDDIPFDLKHRRVVLYENSILGCKKLEKALSKNLLAMLGSLH